MTRRRLFEMLVGVLGTVLVSRLLPASPVDKTLVVTTEGPPVYRYAEDLSIEALEKALSEWRAVAAVGPPLSMVPTHLVFPMGTDPIQRRRVCKDLVFEPSLLDRGVRKVYRNDKA